jgi:dTDP-3-amino-3,4,6-trideoxy-alpha-D-glucose transaminase
MLPPRTVEFLDVGWTYRELKADLDADYKRVMESGIFVLGDEVEQFEREFAEFCGADHCVGVASGLDALTLSLKALGVGPGDEVIVPGHTYIATWLAVTAVGAKPLPVDVDPETYNLDAALTADALGPRVRAIIPVHLYGQPARCDLINEVAEAHGVSVLEDAAQAHGATLRGARTGSLGRVAGFSFYPSKNLGAYGDGGAVVTSDPGVADTARLLRNYGSRRKYEHELRGVNSRLDPLQAAFLRTKLRHLEEWNAARDRYAGRYLSEIAGRPGIVELPRVVDGARSAWHTFVLRSGVRDQLADHLESCGVGTMLHYPITPGGSEAYAALGPWPATPVADRLVKNVLSIPMGPHLDDDAVSHVIETVNTFEPAAGASWSTGGTRASNPSG